MKKLILLLVINAYILSISTAQTTDSTLLLLDKTEITTNVLYPHFSNDSNAQWLKYDGNNDSLATSKRWKQTYLELANYFVHPDGVPIINTLIKNAEHEINVNHRIPLMILNFDYQLLKSNAIDSGLITLENGQFLDVVNRSESPYIQKQLLN